MKLIKDYNQVTCWSCYQNHENKWADRRILQCNYTD